MVGLPAARVTGAIQSLDFIRKPSLFGSAALPTDSETSATAPDSAVPELREDTEPNPQG